MNPTKLIIRAAAAAFSGTAALSPGVMAAAGSDTGPFGFIPIAQSADSATWDAAAPFHIPQGFSQFVVADESDLNIYDDGRDDRPDMNTVNANGPEAGRYL